MIVEDRTDLYELLSGYNPLQTVNNQNIFCFSVKKCRVFRARLS